MSNARTAGTASSLPRIADYPVFLAEWGGKARVPREPGMPGVASLFAGCGGSSTGWRMAGFDVGLAVDFWETACGSYRANWPGTRVECRDLTALGDGELLGMAGLEYGELDVLDGSPPCQGFSTAGKRDFGDGRNGLFRAFARALRELRPRMFVMENVSGLVKGKMRVLFREMTRELTACGYGVECRLLDAQWLGVPQERKRVIWIGTRDGLGLRPAFPAPRWRPVSVREALADFGYASRLMEIKVGIYGNKFVSIDKRSAPTIRAAGTPVIRNGGEYRELTWREAMRLHSYPDEYVFEGTEIEKVKQIGNSVPPLMMAQIALALLGELRKGGARP